MKISSNSMLILIAFVGFSIYIGSRLSWDHFRSVLSVPQTRDKAHTMTVRTETDSQRHTPVMDTAANHR